MSKGDFSQRPKHSETILKQAETTRNIAKLFRSETAKHPPIESRKAVARLFSRAAPYSEQADRDSASLRSRCASPAAPLRPTETQIDAARRNVRSRLKADCPSLRLHHRVQKSLRFFLQLQDAAASAIDHRLS
jgi:hypothetical protein